MAATKDAFWRAEEENSHLTDERLSLLMELGAIKEDFTAFRAKSSVEKSALEVVFDVSSDVIFDYGYGCCAFAHDIRGSKPMIPAGMPDTSTPLPLEFFVNPRCTPGSSSFLTTAEPVETTGEDFPVKDFPAAEEGVDIRLGPSTRLDKGPKVVA